MGASESKAQILTKVLNEASIEVMNKNSTSTSSAIDQSNTLAITGTKDSTISGITQTSEAKISVSSLSNSVANGKLQSDLIAELKNKLTQQGAALGYSAADTTIDNIVRNAVNAKITNEQFTQIRNKIAQKNAIIIQDTENSTINSILQSNEAKSIISLVNDMNGSIISEMQSRGIIENEAKQDIAQLFTFSGGIIILLIAVALGVALYFFKDVYKSTMENITKPAPMAAIVVIVLALLGLVAYQESRTPPTATQPSSTFVGNRFCGNKFCVSNYPYNGAGAGAGAGI